MSNMTDIEKVGKLLKIKTIFQHLNQLTWSATKFGKRYPEVEFMTIEDIIQLYRTYLAFGLELEDIYKEWRKLYDDEKRDNT